MLLLQNALHQIYIVGQHKAPEYMIGLLEMVLLYPFIDICVDARAVCDAVSAADVCEPAGSSPKFHFIRVRNGVADGIIPRLYWVDVRDMLADGLTKVGVDRTLQTRVCNACRSSVAHEGLVHTKHRQPGSATKSSREEGALECQEHQ